MNDQPQHQKLPAQSSSLSSRLQSMYASYQEKLKKIDALEHKLEEKVLEKRQRALNLLDEMNNIRHTTLRIFVSHEYDNDQKNKQQSWKLIIEGKQLIPSIDHIAAQTIDKYQTDKASNENRQYVIQKTDMYTDIHKLQSDMDKMNTREKIASRFLYDREGEDLLQPLLFTHFWDKVSVSFQPYSRQIMKPPLSDTEEEQEDDNTNETGIGNNKRKRGAMGGTSSSYDDSILNNSNNSNNNLTSLSSSHAKKKVHKVQKQKMRELQQLQLEKTNFERNGPPTHFIWNRLELQNNKIGTATTSTTNATSSSSSSSTTTTIAASSSHNLSNTLNPTPSSTGSSNTPPDTATATTTATTINANVAENNITTTTTSTTTTSSSSSSSSSNNKDAHAFHVLFEQDDRTSSSTSSDDNPINENNETMTEHMVIATVRLYRRTNYNVSTTIGGISTDPSSSSTMTSSLLGMNNLQDAISTGTNTSAGGLGIYHEQKYKLSPILLNTLFTCFLPKHNKKTSMTTTTTTTNVPIGGGSAHTINNTNNSIHGTISSSTTSSFLTPPIDNDIHIPKVFTLDEILTAFYIYITDNKLQQQKQAPTSSESQTKIVTSTTTSGQNNVLSSSTTNDNDNPTISGDASSAAASTSPKNISSSSPTLIYNDAKLKTIFNQPTMEFHQIKHLLLSKNLIIPTISGTPGDAPIVLTYIMKKDNASLGDPMYVYDDEVIQLVDKKEQGVVVDETVNNQVSSNDNDDVGNCESLDEKTRNDIGKDDRKNVIQETDKESNMENDKSESTPPNKRRKVSTTAKTQTQSKKYTQKQSLTNHIPNLLSCDIDVDVPHLFHSRTREILRRIKIREYEYASCRTKALRLVQHSRVSEDDAKLLLENVIRGKSMTKDHIPVCLALAKAAQEDSEPRIGSHICARMSMLMERLEHHTKTAQACWDLVTRCRREA